MRGARRDLKPWTDELGFLRPDWSLLNLWNGIIGGTGIGVLLLIGILIGNLGAAAIAASGAIAVSFGAVMAISTWRGAPLILAGAGMAVSAVIGSVAGASLVWPCVASAAFAALTALASTIGTSAWWIALQWSVALLIAGSFPASWSGALDRGGLVLLGAAVQSTVTLFAWRWRGPGEALEAPITLRAARAELAAKFRERRHRGLFGLRAAITVIAATLITHGIGLANAYWAPMTALVVLKPRWRDTWQRGVHRVLGTLIGAAIASGLALALKSSGLLTAGVAVVAAFAAVSVQRVSYALFTLFLTT